MTSGGGVDVEQKVLKKRLSSLVKKAENKVCCDCPEKGPTWASILPPPKNAPHGSNKMVAFLCMNCAGAHRQLGTHVCRVRSISLDDDWTEEDVIAAEKSGNKKINMIYEGNLKEDASAEVRIKPINGAHGASRQRFVREKYTELAYYSKPAHYRHVDQEKNAALFSPSKDSPGRRTSLLQFLKQKDPDFVSPRGPIVGGNEKSTVTGNTEDSDFNENKSMFQTRTGDELDHVTVASGAHTVGDTGVAGGRPSRSKRASYAGARFSPFSGRKKASDRKSAGAGPTLKFDPEASNSALEMGPSEATDTAAEQATQELWTAGNRSVTDFGIKDDYRDPRRTAFNESRHSIEWDGEETTMPLSGDENEDFLKTPVQSKPRILVASKASQSPSNARVNLYSKTRRRGRSKESNLEDGGSPQSKDRSPSQARESSRFGRGRSKSARHRDSSVDVERMRRDTDKSRGSSKLRTRKSQSPSKSRAQTNSSRSESPSKYSRSQSRSRAATLRRSPSSRRNRDQSSSRTRDSTLSDVVDNSKSVGSPRMRDRKNRSLSRARVQREAEAGEDVNGGKNKHSSSRRYRSVSRGKYRKSLEEKSKSGGEESTNEKDTSPSRSLTSTRIQLEEKADEDTSGEKNKQSSSRRHRSVSRGKYRKSLEEKSKSGGEESTSEKDKSVSSRSLTSTRIQLEEKAGEDTSGEKNTSGDKNKQSSSRRHRSVSRGKYRKSLEEKSKSGEAESNSEKDKSPSSRSLTSARIQLEEKADEDTSGEKSKYSSSRRHRSVSRGRVRKALEEKAKSKSGGAESNGEKDKSVSSRRHRSVSRSHQAKSADAENETETKIETEAGAMEDSETAGKESRRTRRSGRSPSKSRKGRSPSSSRDVVKREKYSRSKSRRRSPSTSGAGKEEPSSSRRNRSPSKSAGKERSPSRSSQRGTSRVTRREKTVSSEKGEPQSPSSQTKAKSDVSAEGTEEEKPTSERRPRSRRGRSRDGLAPERSRSNASLEESLNSSFVLREKGSRRSALERERSNLKKRSSKRGSTSTDTDNNDVTESAKTSESKNTTADDKAETEDNFEFTLDLPDFHDPKKRAYFDDNVSQLSLSLASLYSERISPVKTEKEKVSKAPKPPGSFFGSLPDDKSGGVADDKSTDDKSPLNGEASFQVITNSTTRPFGNPATRPKLSMREGQPTRSRSMVNKPEQYELYRRRRSKTEAAEIEAAERSSRKSNIFASLDREDAAAGSAPDSRRRAPGRTRSGDLVRMRVRPKARTLPSRSKSATVVIGRSVAPKLTLGKGDRSTSGNSGSDHQNSMSNSLDAFNSSFDMLDLES